MIYAILLLPLCYILANIFFIGGVQDPVKYIYTTTGIISTILLMLCLSIFKNKYKLTKYKKPLGLFSFFYAFLHLLNFIVFDSNLNIAFIIKQSLQKPFIYLGMISFFILLFLAITSTKKLFKKFYKYHKLVYISFILLTIHWIMAQKSLNASQYAYILITIILALLKIKQKIKL